jgi:hypothetical protein
LTAEFGDKVLLPKPPLDVPKSHLGVPKLPLDVPKSNLDLPKIPPDMPNNPVPDVGVLPKPGLSKDVFCVPSTEVLFCGERTKGDWLSDVPLSKPPLLEVDLFAEAGELGDAFCAPSAEALLCGERPEAGRVTAVVLPKLLASVPGPIFCAPAAELPLCNEVPRPNGVAPELGILVTNDAPNALPPELEAWFVKLPKLNKGGSPSFRASGLF